jgi:poly(3-hydroxybutyrate) depolymerase
MTSKDPVLPDVKGDCPKFASGNLDYMGLTGIAMQVGAMKEGTGSLIFYWHGTGSGSFESSSFGGTSQVLAAGGIIVAPSGSTGQGGDCSGTGTFSMGDFDVADQIAACAVRDYHIDPHRIYSTGCSAGGLQAGCMGLVRSNYIAAVAPNSGGAVFAQAAQNPMHVPSTMTMHGAPGSDVVIVDFSQTSMTYDDAIKKAGGFVVNCNHGGGHCGAPADLQAAAWTFMDAHPFGVTPEPYTGGLPAGFPSYCMIY